MRQFEPFGDRVLVLPDATPAKTTGLAKPQSEQEKPTEGVVVAAGPLAAKNQKAKYEEYLDVNGERCLALGSGVAVGDRVQFPRYAGRDVMHMGVKHLLLRLEELDGKLVEVEG